MKLLIVFALLVACLFSSEIMDQIMHKGLTLKAGRDKDGNFAFRMGTINDVNDYDGKKNRNKREHRQRRKSAYKSRKHYITSSSTEGRTDSDNEVSFRRIRQVKQQSWIKENSNILGVLIIFLLIVAIIFSVLSLRKPNINE